MPCRFLSVPLHVCERYRERRKFETREEKNDNDEEDDMYNIITNNEFVYKKKRRETKKNDNSIVLCVCCVSLALVLICVIESMEVCVQHIFYAAYLY